MNSHISKHFPTLRKRLSNEKDYKHLRESFEKIEGFKIICFCFLPVACTRSLTQEKDINALILKSQSKICSLSLVTPGELCNTTTTSFITK